MSRFEEYLMLNESRGIREDKIGLPFKFVGIGNIKGDKQIYILQKIDDIKISQYDNYKKHFKNIIEVNKPTTRSKNVTFLQFASKKNITLTIVRFSDKITNIQSKNVGMELTTSSESFKMKPQDFKIPYMMDYRSYTNHIRMMINTLYGNDVLLNEYLHFLIDYVETDGKVKQSNDISSLPLNQIGKNFGEILGPIALFNNSKLFSKKFDKSSDRVIMPTAGNEKLLDYIIEKDGIKYNFSAKYNKGAASSLSSIYDIIKKTPSDFTEFSKEISVLDTITNYSSIEAPAVLCKEWGLINDEQWIAWKNKYYDSPVWDKLKETKKPTATNPEKVNDKPWWILAIMAYMASDYMNSSRFNFKGLIMKAMSSVAVTQINMKLTSKGIPLFKTNENRKIEDIKVVVDAKKGYYSTDRPKQKLSFKIS